MPNVTLDGQSLMVDGKRVWLTAGRLDYLRVPRGLWAKRLAQAKDLGFNAIQTTVYWNEHEPAVGEFDFEGDKDLRHFVELCGEMGLLVVLRVGPCVGSDQDFGGYPAWLLRLNELARVKTELVAFRQPNGPVMQAVNRFWHALYAQIKDVQLTENPGRTENGVLQHLGGGLQHLGGAGPIVLTQIEDGWSGTPEVGEVYFTQLTRMLRDVGCSTPLMHSGHLVYRHGGMIDAWAGQGDWSAAMRQLGSVDASQPKVQGAFGLGQTQRIGEGFGTGKNKASDKAQDAIDPAKELFHLAEVVANGGQVFVDAIDPGSRFGHMAGASSETCAAAATACSGGMDQGLLAEGGLPTARASVLRRLLHGTSQFGFVLAHLKTSAQTAAVAPDADSANVSVLHQTGTRGQAVFVLRGKKSKQSQVDVLLPNGWKLPVSMGKEPVAWFLVDVPLGNAAHLDVTNLRPWAWVEDKLLVFHGPAGSDGLVMLDGAAHQIAVPTGKEPTVVPAAGGVQIVVLNENQADAAHVLQGGLFVGTAASAGVFVDLEGGVETIKAPKASKPRLPKLTQAGSVVVDAFANPDAIEWQTLEGPTAHESTGLNHGSGVYKLALTKTPPPTGKYLSPGSGDRLHIHSGGKLIGLMGQGPGTDNLQPVAMKLGRDVLVYSDNMGRVCDGCLQWERKGLLSHLFRVKPKKLPKVTVETVTPCDPSALTQYIQWGTAGGDPPLARVADQLRFDVKLTVKAPLILHIENQPDHFVLLANGEPVTFGMKQGQPVKQVLLDPRQAPFKSGVNELAIVLSRKADVGVSPSDWLTLYEAAPVTDGKATWQFAPVTTPDAEAFEAAGGKKVTGQSGLPTWHRLAFAMPASKSKTSKAEADTAADPATQLEPLVPAAGELFVTLDGLTKGQLVLNGQPLGRYFVQTHTGQPVGPQTRWWLPSPWLKDGDNELLILDEHGASPAKCELVFA